MKRSQLSAILKDLKLKMVILVGPRQSGKTWLAKEIAKHYRMPLYLNYDSRSERDIMTREAWLPQTDLLILDELHKMPEWKNYLKGVFDTKSTGMHILVTGSARLDVFKKVGDSMAGRYFLHHLMPFSPAELIACGIQDYNLDVLIERSGFPEPYLASDDLNAKRWRNQYIEDMIGIDVLNFDNIMNLRGFKAIFDLLRGKVGSPVSYASIAEDVNLSQTTVKKYMDVLEALYLIFRVRPYSKNIARSLLKEPKIYFFDSGLVTANAGAQLENFVAVCLLKHVYAKRDGAAEEYELYYLRTKDQEEVDFALSCDHQIRRIIEVKTSDHSMSPSLFKFHEKYQFPATQIIKYIKHPSQRGGIVFQSVQSYLESLATEND